MLTIRYKSMLLKQKNLLAFSSGVDSTALFFLLLEAKIEFDIVIVNYNLREESILEVKYAKELALKYSKKIYIKDIKLESSSNFESTARGIRYEFFEQIIEEKSYQNLLTAHQLNDKLEWFLMQFTKGAGLFELLGFQDIIEKKNYKIVKPLLNITKESLESYLKEREIKYFIDKSNFDFKYRRNYFRDKFSNELLMQFSKGVERSFEYLEKDLKELSKFEVLFNESDFFILKKLNSDTLNIRFIDKTLKEMGFLISKAQRDEILKRKDCVISSKVVVVFFENKIFISPYLKVKMEKDFKEKCRVFKIPAKVRSYLFSIEFNKFDYLLKL